jgi:uncharacterized repeat protein (TIGR03803 family)
MRNAQAHEPQSHAYRPVISNMAVVLILISASMTVTVSAQTFTSMGSLDYTFGKNPQQASIVQGVDGNFYGAANTGGTFGEGAIFKVTPDGTLSELYAFCTTLGNCTDGRAPSGLVVAGDGNFYGITAAGGAKDFGSLFKLTPDGTLTTVYSFCPNPGCFQGQVPTGALALGTDGNFYGTTQIGGFPGHGIVFKISPTGTLTTLHVFCKQTNCPDGANPVAGLVLARDGTFYGTTTRGGATGQGTIFRIGPTGNFTTLHNFCMETNCSDGQFPNGPLVVKFDGNIFGTTGGGGTGSLNGSPSGLIYELTTGGTYSVIYNFCVVTNCDDGISPQDITLGGDGRFYGVTADGGFINAGTTFRLTPTGVLNTLHSFRNVDGRTPQSAIVQSTDGFLYGTTTYGGIYDKKNCQLQGCGTVYRMGPPGLKAFVKTVQPGGHVGDSVIILGNNLTGTTSVSFHGTAASFTVVSATEITATVPTGATTGTIQVVTPSSTLNSNVVYRILN